MTELKITKNVKSNEFKFNNDITKLIIGGDVTYIGKNAFEGCKNLKSISVEETNGSLLEIKDEAFKDCTNLESFDSDKRVSLWKNVFINSGVKNFNSDTDSVSHSSNHGVLNFEFSEPLDFEDYGTTLIELSCGRSVYKVNGKLFLSEDGFKHEIAKSNGFDFASDVDTTSYDNDWLWSIDGDITDDKMT